MDVQVEKTERGRRGFGDALKRLVFVVLAGLMVLTSLAPMAFAESIISLSYRTKDQLSPGAIISLNQNQDGVEAASIKNVGNIFGVVVVPNQSLLTFKSNAAGEVQVATTGINEAIVSNLNGDIKAGDQITASPLPGVGMKATENVKVVGTAQVALADSPGKRKQEITDGDGKKRTIEVGTVPVALNVAYFFKEPTKTVVPTALQNVANSVAGRQVQPLPIIICLVIFIVAMIAISSLVYAAIRGSIISVGRNPLSQAAVYRSLLQISVLILAILGGAVTAIYLILTRL